MRGLKVCLWIAGLFCLLAVFGLFLPMSTLRAIASLFAADAFPDGPLFVYLIRVMSATYVGVGVFYIILARERPSGLSARNALAGRVVQMRPAAGNLQAEIAVDGAPEGAATLQTIVTKEAAAEMELERGARVYSLFKSSALRPI